MTPAILVDRLVKEDLTVPGIALLVFDEAHHCRKNHPYAQVMEYYWQAADAGAELPHIFGMTACPVDGAVRMLSVLCVIRFHHAHLRRHIPWWSSLARSTAFPTIKAERPCALDVCATVTQKRCR